jgi:DNA adenine methylase
MAAFMRSCKGRVMVSINDHPDIRAAFDGMHMRPLRIRYSMANKHGTPAASSELMITNYEPVVSGGMF